MKSWFNDGIRSVDDISARNNKRIKQEEIADEDKEKKIKLRVEMETEKIVWARKQSLIH